MAGGGSALDSFDLSALAAIRDTWTGWESDGLLLASCWHQPDSALLTDNDRQHLAVVAERSADPIYVRSEWHALLEPALHTARDAAPSKLQVARIMAMDAWVCTDVALSLQMLAATTRQTLPVLSPDSTRSLWRHLHNLFVWDVPTARWVAAQLPHVVCNRRVYLV